MNQSSKIVAQYSGRTFRQRNLFSLLNVSFCQQGHKLVFQNWLTAGELSWWGNKNVSPKIRLFFTLYNPSVDWSPLLGKEEEKASTNLATRSFTSTESFVNNLSTSLVPRSDKIIDNVSSLDSSLPKRPSKKPW